MAQWHAVSTPVPASTWLPKWLFLVCVWGFAFWFIKIGDQALAPLQVAFARTGLGAVTLLVILVATHNRLPRSRTTWMDASVVAVFQHTIPFTMFAFAEIHISSILAGILNATMPLFTVLISLVMLPGSEATRDRMVGIAIGFLGVLVVLGVWQGAVGGDWTGAGACLIATISYGIAVNYTRRRFTKRPEKPISLVAAQLSSGAIQLAVLCLIFTAVPTHITWATIGAMSFLGILSTGVAFIFSFDIVKDAGPVIASTTTYAAPLISTAAGAIFLGESLEWNQPVGAVIVLAGVALVQGFIHLPSRKKTLSENA